MHLVLIFKITKEQYNLKQKYSVCTNLWRLKIGAPPVADTVVNHPILLHAILPSEDLIPKQMLVYVFVHNHQSNK